MSLRDAIKDLHDYVENTRFAKLLLSGSITEEVYCDLLNNLIPVYECLESLASKHHLLDGVEDILRVPTMTYDHNELKRNVVTIKPARPIVYDYVKYLKHLAVQNPKLLLAHIYVRHFGDLFGGQIIKKKVPGSGTMYSFNERQELITKMRAILSDDLGDEARVAMQFAIDIFEALADEHNIQ